MSWEKTRAEYLRKARSMPTEQTHVSVLAKDLEYLCEQALVGERYSCRIRALGERAKGPGELTPEERYHLLADWAMAASICGLFLWNRLQARYTRKLEKHLLEAHQHVAKLNERLGGAGE